MTDMGERIKKLRLSRHISRQLLADDIGSSIAAIKAYENGYREPNAKAMAALEQYFCVSGAYLRGETDDPTPQYYWEDPEMVAELREGMLTQLGSLYDLFKEAPADVRDHLVTLLCVLTSAMREEDEELRERQLRMLRACTTYYMEFARNAKSASYRDGDDAMTRKRLFAIEQIDDALKEVQEHYRKLWEDSHAEPDPAAGTAGS